MTGSFEKTYRVMVRRRYHFLLFFASMVVIPMTLAYVLPSLYKAQAVIYLRPGDYKKPFMPAEANHKMSYIEVTMEDVASEVELIQSRPLLEKVVEETGLDKEYIPGPHEGMKYHAYFAKKAVNEVLINLGLIPRLTAREDAIVTLAEKIDIDFIKRSNIITLEYMVSDPDLAMRVVNSLADHYVKYHLKVHGHAEALATIKREMEATRAELDRQEKVLDDYKRTHNVTDIAVERANLISKLTDLKTTVNTFDSISPEDLQSGNWSDIEGDPGFLELRKRLTDLKIERIELATKFGKTDQNVVAVEHAITDVNELMKQRLHVMMGAWRKVISSTQARLDELDVVQMEVARLEREIKGTTDLFNLHREKYHELLIDSDMEEAHVASPRVTQHATRPEGPYFPKRHILLVVCIFLGLVGGASYSYAFDRLANRVTSIEDLEYASKLPVCATLPRYKGLLRRNPERLLAAASWDLMALDKWLVPSPDQRGRCALLLSAGGGAGATLVASLLSGFVAKRHGAKTLFVSIHSRRGTLSFRQKPGLREVCEAGKDVAKFIVRDATGSYDRLDIQLRMDEAVTPKEALDACIRSLKESYDFVVLDVESTRTGPFYFSLTPHAELILLVVGYDRSNASDVRSLAEVLGQNGVRPAGTILNGYCPEVLPVPGQSVFRAS